MATDGFGRQEGRMPDGSDTITIRDATIDDLREVVGIMKSAYAEYDGVLDPPSGVSRETVESLRELLLSAHLVVAEVGASRAGCVLYQPGPDHVYLGRLAVLPEFRNRGLGRALVRSVEERALKAGALRVRLGVRIVLRDLHSWYERQGYIITAEEAHEGYDRPTFVTMEKDVGASARGAIDSEDTAGRQAR